MPSKAVHSPVPIDRTADDPHRALGIVFVVGALVLGAADAWIGRHAMNPDGISYLDMGDAYLRGDWHTAINGLWSPLYSWFLGLALRVFRPSSYWEFPVAHLVNFVVYVVGLACFHFFLRELIRRYRVSADGLAVLPDWMWFGLGYGLYVWSSVQLIGLAAVNPDMCVAAVVYLACGLLLRIRRTSGSWTTFVLLGAVLGLGYLAKAPMLVLGVVFLALGAALVGDLRRAGSRVLVALSAFAVVAGPFVIGLSREKGRLTFGDSARLNYALNVSRVIPWHHWQGEDPRGGTPLHPTRKVLDSPPIYEFGSPIGGTYPPWYDPTYWNDGVRTHLDARDLVRTFLRNAAYCLLKMSFAPLPFGLLAGLLAIMFAAKPTGQRFRSDRAAHAVLFVPAAAGLGMFCMVRLMTRYIAPFAVLLWLALLSGPRPSDSQDSRRLIASVGRAVVFVAWLALVVHLLRAASRADGVLSWRSPAANPYWCVADGLRRMGVRAGDKVACIGSASRTFWARLARVKIVAELPSAAIIEPRATGYLTDPRVIAAFAKTGARVIIAEDVPSDLSEKGWRRIGTTNHYAYFLRR